VLLAVLLSPEAVGAARVALRHGLPLVAGAQPATRVAEWMAAADLVTLPSWSEGHPNVLVEALACGRPVVSCPVGGVPEVVDDACGVLVPPRDAAALAAGLRTVLARDWNEGALSGRHSRSWSAVAADTMAACGEAIAEHAAARGRVPRRTPGE
jgi:glycosyltransferase involved in cell wall biosynthesis